MLLLTKAISNKMYVVCDDILTLDNPIYLWRFVHAQTRAQYLIELVNSAEQNQRYDLFTLILPTDLDLTEGEYIYEIYQSDTTGDENYSAMLQLANGVARVQATFTDNESYEPTGTDTTYTG